MYSKSNAHVEGTSFIGIAPDNTSEKEFEASVRQDVALGPLTTLGIGGPARYFAEADSQEKLVAAIRWSRHRGLRLFVLGGGSNLLVANSGFEGLVLRMALPGLDLTESGDRVTIRAGAGIEWDRVVALAVENGLSGIECISGVPGLVGATPIQNVGAYGQEVSDNIVEVEAVDTLTAEPAIFKSTDCGFGYRTSRFKTSDTSRYIITAVTYGLTPGGDPVIRYPELDRTLAERGLAHPTLEDVRRTVIEIRRSKGMIIDPADPDSRSAGSFFVNPTMTETQLEALKSVASSNGISISGLPVFQASGGKLKLPAAWLIERAGFKRGYTHGRAGLSTKHPLAIVNSGGATAREIIELAEEIKLRVKDIFGVDLIPEPVFIGFD